MNRRYIWILGSMLGVIFLLVLVGFFKFNFSNRDIVVPKEASPLDATYKIGDTSVTLRNGVSEREIAPGSRSKEVTRIFGEPVYGDIDGDGDKDAVMFLTNESGGSGTFYYVAVALYEKGEYLGTNAMFLGDRIAPQTIDFVDGKAVANFAERKTGESFATSPSVGKSVWLHLDPKTKEVGEAVQNFEGEADPSRMTLGMKTWKWINTTDGNLTSTPKLADKFTLRFESDGSVAITTDCNNMGGTYVVKGTSLTFGALRSTLMFCEGSQETAFSEVIQSVKTFEFTGKGELLLHSSLGWVATFR